MVKQLAKRALEVTGLIRPYYRWRERRMAQRPVACVDDGHPMPPKNLITLVSGVPDQVWFSSRGQADASKFLGLAARHGLNLEAALSVLDLGCGCGRIARWLAPRVSANGGAFHGSDINRKLIAWCAAHLPGRYFTNELAPPLNVPAASLDLVYAYSVLTHLTEASATAWLKEIRRVLKAGGLAIVTFHDETFAEKCAPPEVVRRLQSEQYIVWNNALEGSNYMSTWTTRNHFRELAAPVLKVLEILPGEAPDQAVAVLASV